MLKVKETRICDYCLEEISDYFFIQDSEGNSSESCESCIKHGIIRENKHYDIIRKKQ